MDAIYPSNALSPTIAPSSTLSRNPSRRQEFTDHELNPLLTNLSPSSTLEALATTDAVPPGKRQRQSFIHNSVASASTSERAWGIKAAFAGKKLREWYAEVSSWSWGGYETEGGEEGEIWDGISTRAHGHYEDRIETIKDDMETLEVEDLKNYVRSAHFRHRTRDLSIPIPATDYEHLGDFTAIITATTLQALPTLSRLSALLTIWTTRLIILRQAPGFLKDMTGCQESMTSAWTIVERSGTSAAKEDPSSSREAFLGKQAVLQDQITVLGRRLDNMLDLLEGSKDVLPARWVDILDSLENKYSLWVVKAEERLLNFEIEQEQEEPRRTPDQMEMTANGTMAAEDQRSIESSTPFAHAQNIVNSKLDAASSPELAGAATHRGDVNENLSLNEVSSSLDSTKAGRRPAPLVLDHHTSSTMRTPSSDIGSDNSRPNSATSDYFSNKSSPEIKHASLVEFISSPALVTSPWSNGECADDPSHRFSRHIQQSSDSGRPDNQLRRASTYVPSKPFGDSLDLTETIEPRNNRHTRTRSASMQAIEVIPKNEVRKIMVRRSESYTISQSAKPEMDALPAVPRLPTKFSHLPTNFSPSSSTNLGNQSQPGMVAGQQQHTTLDRSKTHALAGEETPLPIKTPHRFEQVSDLSSGLTPVKIRKQLAEPHEEAGPVAPARTPVKVAPNFTDDRLEAQISSILTEIPVAIRLTSGPEPDAPEVNRFGVGPKTPARRTPAMQLNRAQTSITPPMMTLAPAQPKSFKSRAQNGEPEIKLYHLHQSGKDVPIKLFVRLVGETGERVMVRIGGGWADLAEYLKEYASHHGRRSVSDTRFDIKGLQSSPASQASPSSRPTSSSSSRPIPAIAFRRQQTTPGHFESPQTPVSDPSVRSVSRMSWADEESPSLGLAGPKTKNVEISPKRQAWVDDMLEQARGSKEGKSIGNVGKVGGIKRVFFKGKKKAESNS